MDIANSFHVACMLNDTTRVKDLLRAGAHRNTENASGSTALELADFLRRVEIVKLLLHDINIKEEGGYELLKAIRVHRMTVVQALLEMGMNEELGQDQAFCKGLLTMTCCVGNAAVLETLVKYGPQIEILSFRDVLLQCALAAGNIEVVDGIGRILSNERGIRGSNMDSASDISAVPSFAGESVTMDPFYGPIQGWDPTMNMYSEDLWKGIRGL